jgi:hypothetical protein
VAVHALVPLNHPGDLFDEFPRLVTDILWQKVEIMQKINFTAIFGD